MADEDSAVIESIKQAENQQESAVVDGEAAFDEQFPGYRREPVPVVVSSNAYSHFRQHFGDDAAASLQRFYGDHVLEKNHAVAAVFENHPEIDDICDGHGTEGGGISGAGVEKIVGYLLTATPYKTLESLERAHPELFAIVDDHYDEEADIVSPVGVHRALAYIGEKSGFRHNRGKR